MDLLKGQLLSRSGVTETADAALADKQVILFYFCASWCPPSRVFTPILLEFYNVRHFN